MGVTVGVGENQVAAVVDGEGGNVDGLCENEGTMRRYCRGGLLRFHVHFWSTSRHKALTWADMINTRSTLYPRLIACDANMEPEIFAKERWLRESMVVIKAPYPNNLT